MRITTGKPSIASNKPREILTLHGEKLLQGFCACLHIARQNHRLHVFDAILCKEHVLGATEADALGAKEPSLLRVAWNVGIRANAEVSAELVRPFHESGEVVRLWIRLARFALTEIDFARGAVKRDPIALLQRSAFYLRIKPSPASGLRQSEMDEAPTTQGRPMPRATTAA